MGVLSSLLTFFQSCSVIVKYERSICHVDRPDRLFSFSGSEDFLQPLHEARELMEQLAMEELAVGSAAEKTRYTVRGPLLGRMELVCQLFHNGMHNIPLNLGELEHVMSIGTFFIYYCHVTILTRFSFS